MIHLQLARWHWTIDVDPPALAASLAERYAAFLCAAEAGADMRIDLRIEPPAAPGEATGLPATKIALLGDAYLLDGPHFRGMIHADGRQADLSYRGAAPAWAIEYFLRVVAAVAAYHGGGLLVHGAALQAGDAIFLLVGQSGSGKSTAVALSHAAGKAVALGDDLVLLRPEGDGWRAYGTPFWNIETVERGGQTSSGLVTGIYKLIKDDAIFAEPMGLAAATAELLANAPVANDLPALSEGLIGRCRSIVQRTGMQRLHFRKDAGFWSVLAGSRA